MGTMNLKMMALSAVLIAAVAGTTVGAEALSPRGATGYAESAAQKEKVTLTYPKSSIELTLGSRLSIDHKLVKSAPVDVQYAVGNPGIVKVNRQGVLLPVAAGTTTVTITVSSTNYTGQLKLPVTISAAKPATGQAKPAYEVRKVKAGGRTFAVNTVTIPKGTPVTIGVGDRTVGATQTLAGIAKAYNADVAINGTFFEAYGGAPDPYGNLIIDGAAEHMGNLGTTIGFKWDGSAVMDSLRLKVYGEVEGSRGTRSWYAYFINRKPTSGTAATLFTPKRGAKLGFAAEKAIIVQNGIVKRIASNENAAIPKDGYVLVYMGAENGQASRFEVGDKVSYEVEYTDIDGNKLDWSGVHTAIGAGPRLVKDGKAAVNAAVEGFRDPKILTGGGARSGIAILKDGSVMIATVSGATMQQWAQVMASLGAQHAMNLDGGASSGLWYKGKTITSPGRELSNALLFGERLKW
ncbi:phosphodiester glycosidase family protein [Paenibacillus oenotherae]|uniref:Phosphodiester glycosidase family protein n=1 Tax=Paenibacillus oenotherae TaxID=1435645 RepID=A0ABS7D3S2_9BACL|nr:phosphodiester glycosidase family protein [Paenibacillus oenotherae]MBW7474478.1 phosphodiester glycosidase family protein [Paenibacillus oenotherae]